MMEPVRVEADPNGAAAATVRSAADRLGVPISFPVAGLGPTRIGDVVVPDAPPRWHVESALLRATAPKHVLFLCVANSARSQLGEGIGRSLAPGDVRISSAGSAPTSVRPQAVEVLQEIGIDITGHRSTGLDEVERPVDAVITLCAEEVCPVWLEDARRLDWALPDPAGVEGSEEQQLEAFRAVRDELLMRLGVLFGR